METLVFVFARSVSVILLMTLVSGRVTKYRGIGKEKTFVVVGKHANYTWPNPQLSSTIAGDIMVGALHMVHERSEEFECGPIMPQGGIQALEVMLYTLRKVNKDKDFLPGFTLGLLAKDDCDGDIYGLKQSVAFIRGVLGDSKCEEGMDCETKIISGVIAAPSSGTSIQVANLLKLFKIPQVSFFSTSARLSNRDRFPYFLRTIPSDVNQVGVMVELVKMFNWKYVSVVYEESTYGFQAYSLLQDHLRRNDICIAATAKLVKDSGVATKEAYLAIIDVLMERKKARGVIIFGSDQEVGEMMRAVRAKGVTGYFTWIGSDGWGARALAYETLEEQVEGAITVQPLAHSVKGFDEYFLNLTPENNKDNPWFVEYWEQQFRCKYPGGRWTPFNENYNRSCTGNEQYGPEYPYRREGQLQFVSDSLLAYAYAIKNLHEDLCGGKSGVCPQINPVDGDVLKDALYNVNFTGLSGINFEFTSNGDGPNKYRILHFRQFPDGTYKWITVGYSINGNFTNMNMSMLQFREETPRHPESICSYPCGPGQYEDRVDECCWYCKTCGQFEYLATKNKCQTCPFGTYPTPNKTGCLRITPLYVTFSDGVAIGAMCFASFGILATIFVIIVFILYRDTAVVKASGRELSFVLLIGIMLCYIITFVLISKPSQIICGIQRAVIGICFPLCYSAILTKTDRIARIFRAGKRTVKRPKFISPKAQLVICFAIFSVQLLIVGIWLFWAPPHSTLFYANKLKFILLGVCKSAVDFSYAIALSYPLLLIIICTVYAVLTRKIPEAFNESKYIGFTMYTTCIIWLAFIPIYLSTGNNLIIRILTLSFAISLSATVALTCMFAPKLYIIILRPERNVRQSMAASKTSSLTHKFNSASRADSSSRSEGEMEMNQRLKSSGSLSSGLSWSTCATQTCVNGNSISTQTYGYSLVFADEDVLL